MSGRLKGEQSLDWNQPISYRAIYAANLAAHVIFPNFDKRFM